MTSLLSRYAKDERATALMEFAFSLPVLLFCAFVMFEFVRFQLARIKVDKAAFMIANATTQLPVTMKQQSGTSYGVVQDTALQALMNRFSALMPSTNRGGARLVISGLGYVDRTFTITGVKVPTNKPIILWAKGGHLGSPVPKSASTVTALGTAETWSAALRMRPAVFTDPHTLGALAAYGNFECRTQPEHMVLVEVFYDYQPRFATLFGGLTELPVNFLNRTTMVSRAFLQPRDNPIEALEGHAAFGAPSAAYIESKKRGFCE